MYWLNTQNILHSQYITSVYLKFLLSELHRCAVFCLIQCGTEIHDTDLVMVDRTLTDICFEDTIIL